MDILKTINIQLFCRFVSAFCCGSISCTDVRLYNLPLVSSSLEIFVRSTKALRFDCIIATCVVVFIHAHTLKFRYGTSNIPNALQEKTNGECNIQEFRTFTKSQNQSSKYKQIRKKHWTGIWSQSTRR